ncbi:MAG: hypothetical protein J6J07_09050 [Oscillospiraceae bacterium]|nr:hypothetical protein [Oscillospiraceae bacterium]
MNNNINSDTNIPNGLGGLVVFVTTGDGTRPIKDALVTVTQREKNEEKLIKSLLTDASGKTETIFLLAPPNELSQTPNNKKPYAQYNIRVDYPGYYSVENVDAPVFSKIINIQPVNLIPLPLDTYVGKTKVFSESESEVLDMGNEREEDV